jgi:S1-C subfamily serine protease
MRTWIIALAASVLVASAATESRAQALDSVDAGPEGSVPTVLITHPVGVKVLYVHPGSPATRGRTENPGEVVQLEAGDIITHINGVKINTRQDYCRAMAGNNWKKLTVIDKQTGSTVQAWFRPVNRRIGFEGKIVESGQ